MSHILRVPGVSERSRAMLKQLLEEDLIPAEAMPHIVESYRRVIHDAHRRSGRANIVVGDRIADALQGLLRTVGPNTGDNNLRIIQAAVRYFVIQDNAAGAGHDLESPHGLDDDARVVNAVLRFLGRDDLMIPDVPPTAEAQAQPARRR